MSSEMDDRKTMNLVRYFFQLCEFCSKQAFNNLLPRSVSNITALETLLQKLNTIDEIHHNLFKDMKTRALESDFKKKVFLVKTILHAPCIAEIHKQH